MTQTAPPRTFADLEPAGLEMAVTCQKCGHWAVIDDKAPKEKKKHPKGGYNPYDTNDPKPPPPRKRR